MTAAPSNPPSPPPPALTVHVLAALDPPLVAAVRRLVSAATEADGTHPLSEHVMLHLPLPSTGPDQHVLLTVGPDGPVVGYGHLDASDAVAGASAELVVSPQHRGAGAGRTLVHQLERLSPDGRLRLWAHGRCSPARDLAEAAGYVSARELWQLRRSLRLPLPELPVPSGYTLRAFRPGQDEPAWLAVNATAFADHPEQGGWTAADLAQRMAEDWFDPAGFLVLDGPDGDLAGFHWTKVHGADGHGHPPIGEVYVVGVAPVHQGRGLGGVLTVAGLRHLRSRGLSEALLYVDADNTAAVRTYSRLGFTRWDVDVQYARPHPQH